MYNCNSIYSARVKDNEENVVLEIPVPGFSKEDLKLNLEENVLLVNGKNEEFTLERSYRLSDRLNVEKIDAEIVNGVLKVTFLKTLPKKIEISVN